MSNLLVAAWDPNGPRAPLALIDISGGRAALRQAGPPSAVIAMVAADDGGVIYTAGPDGVVAWRRTGAGLSPFGEHDVSPGSLPCHLALTAGEDHLVVAHYESGQLSVHPVGAQGLLAEPSSVLQLEGSGPDPGRQDAPHPHMVWCGPGDEVIVADLGTDLLRRFVLEDGTLIPITEISLPPGTGPRHLVVVEGIAYVVGELADTLVAVRLSTDEVLHVEPCGGGAVAAGEPSFPSAITRSRDGRRCYVLRRGPNTISTFELGNAPRLLGETPCGGDWPWDVVAAGDRLYVANQRSGSVSVLQVEPASGLPAPTGDTVTVPAAVSLLLLEPGRSGARDN